MPRRPRVLLSGYPLHIVQRGINREPCFFAEEDYHCYLHWLEETARACRCAIHAYALMTNHVHLLLTPSENGSPARLMQSLGRRYVQYINRFYRRSGSLWEGRYKSSVVQAEDYLLACQRYIELNPVRAGMVNDPGQYRWSSYRPVSYTHLDVYKRQAQRCSNAHQSAPWSPISTRRGWTTTSCAPCSTNSATCCTARYRRRATPRLPAPMSAATSSKRHRRCSKNGRATLKHWR